MRKCFPVLLLLAVAMLFNACSGTSEDAINLELDPQQMAADPAYREDAIKLAKDIQPILLKIAEDRNAKNAKVNVDSGENTDITEQIQNNSPENKDGVEEPQITRPNRAVWTDMPKLEHSRVLARLYSERSEKTFFLDADGKLAPAANVLFAALDDLDAHALSPKSYPIDVLKSAVQHVQEISHEGSEIAGFWLSDYEIQEISKFLEENKKRLRNSEDQFQFVAELVADASTSPVPRLARAVQLFNEGNIEHDDYVWALELALADAYLHYAEEMKYGNLQKFSPEEKEKYTSEQNSNDIHPKFFDEIISERLIKDARALMETDGTEDAITSHFQNLIPQHEQYAKLQKVREVYRGIVANGGWGTIVGEHMNKGGSAPKVMALKKRLAAEGYYSGEIDERFDKPLADAILLYQKTHQLEMTGEPNEVFWKSLNVSAQNRLDEIEVNLRRWHRTMFEPRDYYIYINVPSFTAEIWKGGERQAEHRVVVGSSTKFCNTRTMQWELMNATPLMHAKMTYIVINPFWNVPPRIEMDEYQKKMREDPHWLENSDFEYYNPKGGGRILRQKPGENNALGRVKLIFPNKHNTYLHDTPKQDFFKYPIRAFSHGCMRVENAMGMAKRILQEDGQWNDKEIEAALKRKTEHPIDLNTPIDVFIEYHTVSVDADGRANFLADVYRYVKNEVKPPTPAELRCDPARDRVSDFRAAPVAGP